MTKNASFSTRAGAIAASVGSAVGLGNIWRFPYVAGQNGGGAFILVYILCVLLIGIPVMLSEFVIGRSTHRSVYKAMRQLTSERPSRLLTTVSLVSAVLMLSFYSVVCGWVCDYLYMSLFDELHAGSAAGYSAIFDHTCATPLRSVLWTTLFLLLNFVVMLGGVQHGIERLSRVLMPALFVLMMVFAVRAMFLPGFGKGMKFLFAPNFGALTFTGVLEALGQAFMSLSLGMACMVTYSSYFDDKTSLLKDSCTIAGLDTLVALLSGVMIFPAVFSFGFAPEGGTKLAFEVLPSVFNQIPGGMLWCVLFFMLLLFASLTSTISLSEILIASAIDYWNISRRRATAVNAVVVTVLATLCALSFSTLAGVTIFGYNIFDLFNNVTANILMPLGGAITSTVVGWRLDRKLVRQQLDDGSRWAPTLTRMAVWCMRYVAPTALVFIALHYSGVL